MAKKKKIIIFLLLCISLQSVFGSGKSDIKESGTMDNNGAISISGTMENGLRILPVDIDQQDIIFTVYRGDYIIFKTIDNKSHKLVIPSLGIDNYIPVPASEKPYIKMKESGVIEFSIDNTVGRINVIDYKGSRYWEVSSKEGADLIQNISPFILDVRTEGEYLQGHLENSFLLPVQVLEQEIGLIEKYKDQDILIYCRSGNRSTVASKILLDAGFTNVYNHRYGISGWTAEGYPVVVE
jgi:rhodanese-related sulfurtransferase